MDGSENAQPFHLDGTVPWLKLGNGKMGTALSCVVLLGDAPNTVLGPLMSNFWNMEDAKIADLLNQEIQQCISRSAPVQYRRAGHVTIFPLGCSIVFLFFFFFFPLFFSFLGFQIHKGVSMNSYKGQHDGLRATLYIEFGRLKRRRPRSKP